jgi:hypothetical protein
VRTTYNRAWLEKMQCVLSWDYALCSRRVLLRTPRQGGITTRDKPSRVLARWSPRAISLQAACASIATIPFREVSGPITTILLPTMIHPSLAAADD